MSVRRPGGVTPLERFGQRRRGSSLVCQGCGYEDEHGRWRASTSGSQVRYEYECPSCESVATRTLRIK